MPMISSRTQLCVSLSERPGTFGNRFHNYLYGELKLDFLYRSGTTSDLQAAVAGLRALRIRGCGLSMPYKEQAVALLDELDPIAREIGAVNTIVNEDVAGAGRLKGYNTDATAVRDLLRQRGVGPSSRALLAGSGGMARAVAHALKSLGCRDVVVLSRNREAGERLAARHGFARADAVGAFDVVVNATPVGMRPDPADALSIRAELVREARLVVESVAYPEDTALVRLAREAGKRVVTGFEITLAQGVEQFRLYTGVALRPDQVARAAAVARHSR